VGLAEQGTGLLGNDLLPLLVLALGGALCVGNLLAVVRPPEQTGEGELERAPVARSLGMAALGLVAAVWALASLVS
jgi:hypothetical protein